MNGTENATTTIEVDVEASLPTILQWSFPERW